MKKTIILSILILTSCSQVENKNIENYDQEIYEGHKKMFPKENIDHFPDTIYTSVYSSMANKNIENNDVGLVLIETELRESSLQKVKKFLSSVEFKAQYKYSFEDLLIVNRFEKFKDNYDSFSVSSYFLDTNFFLGLYPIPNLHSAFKSGNKNISIDDSYNLFVLDSKSGNYFPNYINKVNIQMPSNWSNGYSKGIAISEKQKTVIYWFIVW